MAIDVVDHEMDGGEALSKENNGIEATEAADGRLDVRLAARERRKRQKEEGEIAREWRKKERERMCEVYAANAYPLSKMDKAQAPVRPFAQGLFSPECTCSIRYSNRQTTMTPGGKMDKAQARVRLPHEALFFF